MPTLPLARPSHAIRALLLAGLAAAPAPAGDDHLRPEEARLRADVRYLADDLRGGRGVGTRGIDDAADYIAAIFREAGLKPAPGADGYFQHFTIRGEPRVGPGTKLVARRPSGGPIEGAVGESIAALQVGGSGEFDDAPLVFAGFGLTIDDEPAGLKYDDYADVDVKDKVVLILRREPAPADEDHPFFGEGTRGEANFTAKATNAAARGAKAVLMVNDAPSAEDGDRLLDFVATPRGAAIPFLHIKRELADRLLRAGGAPTVAELESEINREVAPRSRALEGVALTGAVEIDRGGIPCKNVVGVLEAEGPLADETIVVGAHYDHLGTGGLGSLAFGSREIHNGADDNASGTATVLELARRLAARKDPLPRRVVFMLFSAEERGLLGAEHYVNNPLYPIEDTVAMINFDMVGRLNSDRQLTIYGGFTSEGFGELIQALTATQGLNAKLFPNARGEFNQSDHAAFYRKDIPVLFFFTGTHPDYHRPGDDWDKINYDGMLRIADVGELALLALARRPDRPEFRKPPARVAAATPAAGAVSGGQGAYFGSRPAYAYEGEGVKLDGVSEGSPAEKAGLQGGDIIVEFAGLKVTDVETYMAAMGTKKSGDEVEVVIFRDGERKTLKAKLGARPGSTAHD